MQNGCWTFIILSAHVWSWIDPSSSQLSSPATMKKHICLGFLCIKFIIHTPWMINRTNSDWGWVTNLSKTKLTIKYLSLYCCICCRTPRSKHQLSSFPDLNPSRRMANLWRPLIFISILFMKPLSEIRYILFKEIRVLLSNLQFAKWI